MQLNLRYRFHNHIKQNFVIYMIILFAFTVGIFTGAYTVSSISVNEKKELSQYIGMFFNIMNKNHINNGLILQKSIINNAETIFIITLLGLVIIGVPFIIVTVGVRGFYIGFTAGFLIHQYAFKGCIAVLLTLLPQNFIIFPCIIVSGVISIHNAIDNIHNRNRIKGFKNWINNNLPYLVTAALIFLATMPGSIIEAFIAPWLLKSISSMLT